MAQVLDPIYEHRVGPHKCRIEDCQGHKDAPSATIHRLYEEFYTSARRVRREKRQEKAEAKIVKAVAGRKRVKGLAPRTTKAETKALIAQGLRDVKEGRVHKAKEDYTKYIKNFHYHKGRRGRCSCEKGDGR